MNSITQTSGHLRNTKPASLDHAKQLAAKLLSERGEASGALVSRELNDVLRALDGNDRHGFQRYLATTFQPDTNALRAAAERYLADTTAEAAAALAETAAEPLLGSDAMGVRTARLGVVPACRSCVARRQAAAGADGSRGTARPAAARRWESETLLRERGDTS